MNERRQTACTDATVCGRYISRQPRTNELARLQVRQTRGKLRSTDIDAALILDRDGERFRQVL